MPLTISEARRNLSDLVKRAEYGHEETVIGPRGKRSAVILGAADLAEIRRRLEHAEEELMKMRRRQAEPIPSKRDSTWDIVGEALEQMEEREPRTRARRFIPNLKLESSLSREERSRIGRLGEDEPEFRRQAPGTE